MQSSRHTFNKRWLSGAVVLSAAAIASCNKQPSPSLLEAAAMPALGGASDPSHGRTSGNTEALVRAFDLNLQYEIAPERWDRYPTREALSSMVRSALHLAHYLADETHPEIRCILGSVERPNPFEVTIVLSELCSPEVQRMIQGVKARGGMGLHDGALGLTEYPFRSFKGAVIRLFLDNIFYAADGTKRNSPEVAIMVVLPHEMAGFGSFYLKREAMIQDGASAERGGMSLRRSLEISAFEGSERYLAALAHHPNFSLLPPTFKNAWESMASLNAKYLRAWRELPAEANDSVSTERR